MREIKFRAKATQNYETSTDGVQKGDWVYGYYYYCMRRETGIIVTQLETESGGMGSGLVQVEIEVDCGTRGQFTGLPDKNGKEMYEGDILGGDGVGKREITLEECEFHAPLIKKHWAIGMNNVPLSHPLLESNAEVIGNIHENPELSREE